MHEVVSADDGNSWKTSQSPPDVFDQAIAALRSLGATEIEQVFGPDALGRAAFMHDRADHGWQAVSLRLARRAAARVQSGQQTRSAHPGGHYALP